MKAPESVVGVLLAGGRSSRMGGGDKGFRSLGGRSILAHVIERLRPQVSAMVINANGDLRRFAHFGLPVVADSVEGYAGPLAGIEAGLLWVKANCPSASAAVTVATDTPFFPVDLVRQFVAAQRDPPALLIASSEEGVHPVIGMWPLAVAPKLKQALGQGMRKVGAFVGQQDAIEVFFPPTEIGERQIDPFFNINRPEDLAEAEALIAVASRRRE